MFNSAHQIQSRDKVEIKAICRNVRRTLKLDLDVSGHLKVAFSKSPIVPSRRRPLSLPVQCSGLVPHRKSNNFWDVFVRKEGEGGGGKPDTPLMLAKGPSFNDQKMKKILRFTYIYPSQHPGNVLRFENCNIIHCNQPCSMLTRNPEESAMPMPMLGKFSVRH